MSTVHSAAVFVHVDCESDRFEPALLLVIVKMELVGVVLVTVQTQI
jgi:hypothetical protein